MPRVYFDSRVRQGYAKPDQNRRQSEVDDNGETYPLSKEGPHLYATVVIPDGSHILSFYNDNKDGHAGLERARDYALSLRVHPAATPLDEVSDFETWPEVARGRMVDFWGGVYKRYRVQGPTVLTMRLNKSSSYDTILAGVFLDQDTEEPQPYFSAPQVLPIPARRSEAEKQMDELWAAMERARERNPAWWSLNERRYSALLARALEAMRPQTAPESLPLLWQRLGTCYYRLNLFPQWEALQKQRGLRTAREIELGLKWDGAPATSGQGLSYVMADVRAHQLKTPAP